MDHTNLISERILNLQGVSNFRDVGGITNKGGKKIKSGLLFRSAELSRLTAKDLELIKGLNVKTILDLRTTAERQSKLFPINNSDHMRIISIPISDREKEMTQKEFFHFLISKGRKFDFGKYLQDIYFKIAFERQDEINKAICHLSDKNNLPAIIHCTAGKDRTGLIVALIQLMLDVEIDNVLKDYLLSNELMEQQANRLISHIRFMSFFRITARQLKPLMEARENYLLDVLDEIHRRYNTVTDYLIENCKIDRSRLMALESIFLETN